MLRYATSAALLGALLVSPVTAQFTELEGMSRDFKPRVPLTPQDMAQREAQALYALGLLQRHGDRLIEATKTLEEAARLDPDAAPIQRALIPLYLILSRSDAALEACRKTLELTPGDYETWLSYAQQLRAQGRPREARAAFARAKGCPGIQERLDARAQTCFDLAALCEDAGEVDEALANFKEVVTILENPDLQLGTASYQPDQVREQAAGTWERMIKLCIQTKRYDQALQLYRLGLVKYPALERRMNYNLARVCIAQGKREEALAHLDSYLRSQPQGEEAYELKIRLLQELGRGSDIVPMLRDSVERDPHNRTLHLMLARYLQQFGEARQAETIYKELAKESPTPDVYRGLLNLYRDQNRMDEVLRVLNDAFKTLNDTEQKDVVVGDPAVAPMVRSMLIVLREDATLVKALMPEVRRVLTGQEPMERGTQWYLAVLAQRAKLLEEAELLYLQCLSTGRLPPQIEVSVYDGLFRVLWQGKKYNQIVSVCRSGVEQARATSVLLFHLNASQALSFLGKHDEALKEADRAVELATDDSRFYTRRNRIRMLRQAEKYAEAEAGGLELLKTATHPRDIRDLHYDLSYVYSLQKRWDKSEEYLRKILTDDPNDATANNDLAYQWADRGLNLDEAERLIRKAIELDRQQKRSLKEVGPDDDKDNAAYIDSLGWVLFRRGDLPAARTWLEKASTLPGGEDDPVVWDHLGDVYYRLEQPAQARTVWLKAKHLYETDKARKADEQYRELLLKLQRVAADRKQP